MSTLRYAARIGGTKVLGPGNRAVIWTYGCPRNCPGCLAENFRNGESTETTAEEMAAWYLEQNAAGLTISGGEPMLQPGPLAEIVRLIRKQQDTSVIVYTGYLYEELLEMADSNPDLLAFLSRIDLLIDGPYIRERDRNQPYIGSDNQRLILLTDRFKDEMTYYTAATGRKIEFHLSEQRTLMVGVPGREQKEIWERIKRIHER